MRSEVVTIRDVSSKCGLSVATVSKALNGYHDVNEETRKRVEEIAREMGYHPNAVARTLKTRRSRLIGVLFEEESGMGITSPFFSSVLSTLRTTCTQHGYDLVFLSHGDQNMSYLEHSRWRNVDGVCILCAVFEDKQVRELAQSNLPCVTIDHCYDGVSCVLSDNASGVRMLTKRAIELGHTRIAYIHGEMSTVTQSRISAFTDTMRENGLNVPPKYLVPSSYVLTEAGYKSMKKLMQLPIPPSCVLLSDDHTSIGAQDAIREFHRTVPNDLSIAGFDGIELTQALRPRLTTVKQDALCMGCEAALELIRLIEQDNAFARTVLVPTQLVEGETLAAAPKN